MMNEFFKQQKQSALLFSFWFFSFLISIISFRSNCLVSTNKSVSNFNLIQIFAWKNNSFTYKIKTSNNHSLNFYLELYKFLAVMLIFLLSLFSEKFSNDSNLGKIDQLVITSSLFKLKELYSEIIFLKERKSSK